MTHPRPNYNNFNSIPVLHIEESVKKYYDVKSKHGHTHRKKYYDIDWRFYIVQKYGRYMVCGTRCPMREYYNEAWPIVSAAFNTEYDVFKYVSLLIGSNKVNMTLFVSYCLSGNDNDIAFTQPTNARFRELDAERGDRHGELVGYDRISVGPSRRKSKLEKTLEIMSSLNNGGVMPFTVSPHPAANQRVHTQQQAPQANPTFHTTSNWSCHARATQNNVNTESDEDDTVNNCNDNVPALESLRVSEVEKYDDYYGYVLGDHDAYAEVD